ncbi:MAG: hypothetical protein OXC95_05940, partial [Dehalococcoidia bacterium]|nr:hypothetical protein [Dehalococcoidia bacterium]
MDRISLMANVRDYLEEEIQRESDSRVEVESESADNRVYSNLEAEGHAATRIQRVGGQLYSAVKDSFERRMRDRTSRADIESDMTDVYAFARIDAERYFDDGLWYLSVRLYSNDSELRAEVLLGAALEDETSSRPAPTFMRGLIERFDCRVGPHRLGVAETEGELRDLLFNPERTMPILMLSRNAQGALPYDGLERLAEQLLGMALVVEAPPEGSRRSEWGYQFDVWDGAARIIWPGAKPHFLGDGEGGFYRPGRRDFVSDVLYDLDRNASRESFEREFTAVMAACTRSRRRRPLFHIRLGESQDTEDLRRRASIAESEQQWLVGALASERTARVRVENELNTARKEAERLREELEAASKVDAVARATETIRNLRRENESLTEEVVGLNGTNLSLIEQLQLSKQRERITQKDRNRSDSLIGDPTVNPGQLSLVGHGLNIMRDPVRRHITEGLARAYNGRDEVQAALNWLGVDT